jgi:hypothetical protein
MFAMIAFFATNAARPLSAISAADSDRHFQASAT